MHGRVVARYLGLGAVELHPGGDAGSHDGGHGDPLGVLDEGQQPGHGSAYQEEELEAVAPAHLARQTRLIELDGGLDAQVDLGLRFHWRVLVVLWHHAVPLEIGVDHCL